MMDPLTASVAKKSSAAGKIIDPVDVFGYQDDRNRLNPRFDGAFLNYNRAALTDGGKGLNPRFDGAFLNSNRAALTDGGKVKFADLTTGIIRWRNNPPKCSVSGADAVMALLEANPALARFVRTKKEVNKDAVLNEPEFFAANPVPGIKIVQGKEFFVIEPYNQELPGA